ncbi:MAG: DUF2271 domain-containing protein [Bacteroidota bacterium]
MKNRVIYIVFLALTFFVGTAFLTLPSNKYKCMVQLVNYTGEGAYIIVSVLDENSNYLKTLRVFGDDEEWYPDLKEWYAFHESEKEPIDGITGATIAGGERSLFAFEVDPKYMGKNYKLRFETAVEDQKYVIDDVNLSLTDQTLNGKHKGSGYIRYVKILNK